jgi:preprotein translocase SecE subunit
MITFIKDSVRELKHVVWPTREETKSYFMMVLVTLILFGLYLFIANTVFSEIILNVLPKIF